MFAGASLDENSGAFCELKANFFRLILTKAELIDLYDKLGYSYFDMIMDDLDNEMNTFRELKKKGEAV